MKPVRTGSHTSGSSRCPAGMSSVNVTATEADNDEVSWGLAEFIGAEEFGGYRGYWWAPDGNAVLAARVDETRVQRWHLHDPASPGTPARTIAYLPSPSRPTHQYSRIAQHTNGPYLTFAFAATCARGPASSTRKAVVRDENHAQL